jgi:hypothetical protein
LILQFGFRKREELSGKKRGRTKNRSDNSLIDKCLGANEDEGRIQRRQVGFSLLGKIWVDGI